MDKYSDLSLEQHQEISTRFIILLRETLEERIQVGIFDRDDPCGHYSKMLDDLIWCYFDNDRETCGIPHPSSLMSMQNLIQFIDEKVLASINAHRGDILSIDWQGKWQVEGCAEEFEGFDTQEE